MEALIATVALLVLIVAALVVLGRGWPSSNRAGGFRTWTRGASSDDPDLAEERGEAPRDDDETRWYWDDREGHDDA